jgi:hypothetical protein
VKQNGNILGSVLQCPIITPNLRTIAFDSTFLLALKDHREGLIALFKSMAQLEEFVVVLTPRDEDRRRISDDDRALRTAVELCAVYFAVVDKAWRESEVEREVGFRYFPGVVRGWMGDFRGGGSGDFNRD